MSKRVKARGAIRPSKTPTVGAAPDADAVKRCSGARSLRATHAWVDPDGDPEDPSSYRFPHHVVSPDGEVGAASLPACHAALRSIESSGIPEEQRDLVRRHLAGHLKDGAQHVPETHTAGPRPESRWALKGTQLKRSTVDGKIYLTGLFAVYNVRTELEPGIFEIIAPGAFADAIAGDDIRCVYNHNSDNVLGRTSAGTLRIFDSPEGPCFECLVDEGITDVGNLLRRVRRRDVRECSFNFDCLNERFEYDYKTGSVTRWVLKVKLYEIGPVTFPQYDRTSVSARSQRFGDAAVGRIVAAVERIRSGDRDPQTLALVRSAAPGLEALIPTTPTGPTPEERARYRERVLTLRAHLRAA